MYATVADIQQAVGEDLLIQLSDRATPPTGAIDAAVVDQAIADAQDELDGYLRVRYGLPLATVPGMVRQLTVKVALYKLFRDDPTEKAEKDYETALKQLKEIAGGTIKLDVAGAEPASAPADVEVAGDDRQFTRESMTGF